MLELLISKQKDKKEIGLIENDKLVEYYIEEENENRFEGNIYVGVIKDIVKGMQSAFVDIGIEKNSFIHLKDLLPKVDETKQKISDMPDIVDFVKFNQKIIVQVKKDSNNQKGARVSTHINLPSKYIVLMPNTDIITISQKITDKKEHDRLFKIVKENLSDGNGAIIRTSAFGKEKELIEDIKYIESKWNKIYDKANKNLNNAPKLLYKAEDLIEKMIIDFSDKKIDRVVVDTKDEYSKILQQKNLIKELSNTNIELKEKVDIFDIYNIKAQIEKLSQRKIWLKCGGFITIDKTEALTAIDVNTGKYTGNINLEDTIFKVNEEATVEAAKQLRLRDIGGIIIIDYIDMINEDDKKKIINLMNECLKKDRTKTQVEGFTKLDLLEMTRKHICSHKE